MAPETEMKYGAAGGIKTADRFCLRQWQNVGNQIFAANV
jgi:hypothetical protein